MNKQNPLSSVQATLLIIGSALALLSPLLGCRGEEATFHPAKIGETSIDEQSEYHLEQGFDFLAHRQDYEPERVRQRIQEELNQWILRITKNRLAPDWVADPLIETLPSRYSNLLQFSKFEGNLFILGTTENVRGIDDIQFLEDAMMAKHLSSWISHLPIEDAAMRDWLAAMAEQDAAKTETLGLAYRLFDWTIRNIQLDENPAWVDKVEEIEESESGSAIPLPGGRYDPMEAVRLGHGDAIERGRAFIALARQQGLTVVMLAQNKGEEQMPRPWAAALLLDEDLYLFDPATGLPFPAENDAGIATLAQLVETPSLLQQLEVDDFRPPIRASALEEVIALIDAEPPSLSLRMRALEDRLKGERKMRLALQPSQLANRLETLEAIADAQLWVVPLEVIFFRTRLYYDTAGWTAWLEEYWPYLQFSPFAQARAAHFRGEFDSAENRRGAKQQYMDSRPPSENLERMIEPATAEALLRESGELPVDGAQRQEAIESLQHTLEMQQKSAARIKRAATYFLSLASFDNGEISIAASLLSRRIVEADPETPWMEGAKYNLARSYETLAGRSESASLYQQTIDLYRASDSPQRHGNLIRARRLETRLTKPDSDAID